jgi:leucyl-tRNA synthetase
MIKILLLNSGRLILVSVSASKDDIEKLALADDNVMRFIDDKPVKKVIVVPKRLVNIVV